MKTCTFTRGVPGCGKTTAARALAAETGAIRVSLDDLRDQIGEYDNFTPQREKLVLRLQEDIVLRALRSGRDVIVDATHLHPKTPKLLATLIWEAGISVQYDILDLTDVPIGDCVKRNQNPGRRVVPDDVMAKMWSSLQSQKRKGLWTVADLTLPEIVPCPYPSEDNDLPAAVIADIDGTLADFSGLRGPYDFGKYDLDRPRWAVINTLCALAADQYDVILMSGRRGEHREATEAWLERWGIPFTALHMRDLGDHERRDSIIKLELFNRHVRGKYNVRCVLDDRDRVVGIWRALGLDCFQVQRGDF